MRSFGAFYLLGVPFPPSLFLEIFFVFFSCLQMLESVCGFCGFRGAPFASISFNNLLCPKCSSNSHACFMQLGDNCRWVKATSAIRPRHHGKAFSNLGCHVLLRMQSSVQRIIYAKRFTVKMQLIVVKIVRCSIFLVPRSKPTSTPLTHWLAGCAVSYRRDRPNARFGPQRDRAENLLAKEHSWTPLAMRQWGSSWSTQDACHPSGTISWK